MEKRKKTITREQVWELLEAGKLPPIKKLTDDMFADKDIILACIKIDPMYLQYASNELKKDKEVVETAVKLYPRAISLAHKSLRDDQEMRKLAFNGKNGFIVDPEAFLEFDLWDKKLIAMTAPVSDFKNAMTEEQMRKQEADAFDAFLNVGEYLVSCHPMTRTHEEKEIAMKAYFRALGRRSGIINLSHEVSRLTEAYNFYKKFNRLYVPNYIKPLTIADIKELEKWLLDRREFRLKQTGNKKTSVETEI